MQRVTGSRLGKTPARCKGLFAVLSSKSGIYRWLTFARHAARMRIVIISLLLLCGCASASPGYLGVTPVQVERGGFVIQVWHRGNHAQAIRMGYATRREQAGLRAHLLAAVEEVTGCRADPARVAGDTGVLNAALICPDTS